MGTDGVPRRVCDEDFNQLILFPAAAPPDLSSRRAERESAKERIMTRLRTGRCGDRFPLDNREAFSLPQDAPCSEIVCTEGVLWVTFSGDEVDYLLSKGERLSTERKKGAVISGIGRSEFSLVQDDGARASTPLNGFKRSYA
jgi:Protein of unknown function (DUF2917)